MAAPFVHPQALCESTEVGEDSRLWAFSHIQKGAKVGRGCNLGEHVFIESNVRIGDHCTIKNGVAIWDKVELADRVFVGPYVVFTNVLAPRAFIKRGSQAFSPTRIGQGATLGANSTIVCGIEVGEFAFVAAGAVVTKNVPPHSLVVGVPGRIIGKVCYCGHRLGERELCPDCGVPLSENSLEATVKRLTSKPV